MRFLRRRWQLLWQAAPPFGCRTSYDASVPPLPTVQAAAVDNTPRPPCPRHGPWRGAVRLPARRPAASRTPMQPPASSRAAKATTTPSRYIRGRKARSIRSMPQSGRSTTIALEPGESLTGARANRGGRHRPLDHRRHGIRFGREPPRPYPREADATRHRHQPCRHHRPAHLHDRAARPGIALHARRRLGLSRDARPAPHRSDSPDHPSPRRRGTIATPCRCRAIARHGGRLRPFDDGRRVYVVFPAGIVQGEMPPIFVLGANGEPQIVNSRVHQNVLIVDACSARPSCALALAAASRSSGSSAPTRRRPPTRSPPARPEAPVMTDNTITETAAPCGCAPSRRASPACPARCWRASARLRCSASAAHYLCAPDPRRRAGRRRTHSTENRPTADGLAGLPSDYSGPVLGPALPETAVRSSKRRTEGSPSHRLRWRRRRRSRRGTPPRRGRSRALKQCVLPVRPAHGIAGRDGHAQPCRSWPRRTARDAGPARGFSQWTRGPADRRAGSPAPPASPYILQAGAVIRPRSSPASVRTCRARSRLVTENVYDSPTGSLLLIPQGTRIVANTMTA